MRRTDRLFEIIQLMRSASAPVRAAQIAAELEVSNRTIYRDIATLQAMRIPILGEAGVGYVMRAGYDLPPLNFDMVEREAIIVGLSLLERTGDDKLRQAANRVLSKINLESDAFDTLQVSGWGIEKPMNVEFGMIRDAIRSEQKLNIQYRNVEMKFIERVILPLGLTYYVDVAVIAAWCEVRQDFRHFRVDRIRRCRLLAEFFTGQGRALRRRLDTIKTN